MEKLKSFIVFCILSLSLLIVKSQSTGFMNKRLHVGYGFHFSPALIGANSQNETIIGGGGSAQNGSLAFNNIHEGFFEVAPSSKLEIGISVRYYKTAYDNAKEFKNLLSLTYSQAGEKPTGYYNIKGITYTFYCRYFGSRYVAPWGRYLMFGPVINTVKTDYDSTLMKAQVREVYSATEEPAYFGPKSQKYNGINFMFGSGRSRIIGNRISLDYGFNIHVLSVLSTYFDLSYDSPLNRNITAENYIRITSMQRVRGVNRFNLYIKIGLLLF